MSKKLHLGTSPITPIIYAGNLNKSKTMWAGEGVDVTEQALGSVFDLIANHGKTIQANYNGKMYTLELVEVTKEGSRE